MPAPILVSSESGLLHGGFTVYTEAARQRRTEHVRTAVAGSAAAVRTAKGREG